MVAQLVLLVWQAIHNIEVPFSNCDSGMWLPGLPVAACPLWQDAQLVAAVKLA